MFIKFVLIVFLLEEASCSYCDPLSIAKVGRVVFGEARGESSEGQLAVAYTVVNRINSNLYPNTLDGVLDTTYANERHHEYNTLDVPSHTVDWRNAMLQSTQEYLKAKDAATNALCGKKPDPTGCATAYCASYIQKLFCNYG